MRSTPPFATEANDTAAALIRQHVIDPEICIRCNTCEATCPQGAVTHDDRNYVVDADKCNLCMACVPPCPTGSINNWRTVPRARAYSVVEQLGWEVLPEALSEAVLAQAQGEGGAAATATATAATATAGTPGIVVPDADGEAASAGSGAMSSSASADLLGPAAAFATATAGAAAMPALSTQAGAVTPPWSAAHPYVNLYGPRAAEKSLTATVAGNVRVTAAGRDNDTHHIVLDFGSRPFPVLEGQSVGIVPPGQDALGRAHVPRQYSVASPRNGERPGYNNVSLTVKRVLADHQGQPVHGLASNYLCDLKPGERVQVTGPFGASFLMPNHPRSHIVMICTGTGSAPMRAMTEWRRRLRASGRFDGGRLMLFFGARTPQELPYFGPLQSLPKAFIDINLAFSRLPDQPRRYVQDLMRERALELGALLADADTYVYVCGLKSMEAGVLLALQNVAQCAGLDWSSLGPTLKREGRLHFETY